MASLLGVLAHPHRVRIIEELRNGELDVNSLQDILGVSHSRVSQHLSVLRSHRIVTERREGRHVFYRLLHIGLAKWLLDGLVFLSHEQQMNREIREAVETTLQIWSGPETAPHQGNGNTHPGDRDITN